MMDFVKKTFQKIEEFRDANAMAEQAKTKLAVLLSQIEKIEKERSDKIKVIESREKEVLAREVAILSAEGRTRKKLDISIDELNKRIFNSKEEISALSEEKKLSLESLNNVKKETANAENEKQKAIKDLLDIQNDLAKARKTLSEKEERNKKLDFFYKQEEEKLEKARKENADISKRKQDLDLYARRIQRYYDEQNLNIKI